MPGKQPPPNHRRRLVRTCLATLLLTLQASLATALVPRSVLLELGAVTW